MRASPHKRARWTWVSISLVVLVTVAFFAFKSCVLENNVPWYYDYFVAPRNAREVARALNAYYSDHQEYPAYLLGGVTREVASWTPLKPMPDPLIGGGYLGKYPILSYRNDWTCGALSADIRLPRRKINVFVEPPRMVNQCSAPDDPLVELYRAAFDEVYSYLIGMSEEVILDKVRALREEKRYLVAGGLPESFRPWQRVGGHYTVVIPEVDEAFSGTWLPAGNSFYAMYRNFGYQRGDFIESIDGTAREAWLWMYGAYRPRTTDNLGLDLVNPMSGEINPDGIPDGIIVLYELRDGEVTKITRAEDM